MFIETQDARTPNQEDGIKAYAAFVKVSGELEQALKHKKIELVAKGMRELINFIESVEEIYGIDFEHCVNKKEPQDILKESGYVEPEIPRQPESMPNAESFGDQV